MFICVISIWWRLFVLLSQMDSRWCFSLFSLGSFDRYFNINHVSEAASRLNSEVCVWFSLWYQHDTVLVTRLGFSERVQLFLTSVRESLPCIFLFCTAWWRKKRFCKEFTWLLNSGWIKFTLNFWTFHSYKGGCALDILWSPLWKTGCKYAQFALDIFVWNVKLTIKYFLFNLSIVVESFCK